MGKNNMDIHNDGQEVICHWTARKMKPIILIYVGAVFIVFILLSYFIFHSGAAVKALAFTALGSILPLYLQVVSRIEYRLTR